MEKEHLIFILGILAGLSLYGISSMIMDCIKDYKNPNLSLNKLKQASEDLQKAIEELKEEMNK